MAEAERILLGGGGTMGCGIAALFTKEGWPVTLYMRRRTPEAKAATMDRIAGLLRWMVDNQLMEQGQVDSALAKVSISNDLESARDSTFVIENVEEDVNIKKPLFAELDKIAPPQTILATNSSSINLGILGTDMVHRDRLLATHFYNPPYLIPLVEIARSAETAEWAVQRASSLMTRIGKVVVHCQDRPGYVAVRMQIALVMEAIALLEQGVASAEDIDRAVRNSFGPRLAAMGPLEMADRGGLDIWLKTAEFLYNTLGHEKYRPPKLLYDMVAKGELGLKSGRGLHGDAEKLTSVGRDRILLELIKQMGAFKEVR